MPAKKQPEKPIQDKDKPGGKTKQKKSTAKKSTGKKSAAKKTGNKKQPKKKSTKVKKILKSKAVGKHKKTKKKPKPLFNIKRLFIFAVVFLISVSAYQYYKVIDEFIIINQKDIEIYSSSLEIYPNKTISLSVVKEYLDLSGFSQQKSTQFPYSYVISGQQIAIFLPEFHYPDEVLQKQIVQIEFYKNHIKKLKSLSQHRTLAYLRLPPVRLVQTQPGIHLIQKNIDLKSIPKIFIKLLLLVEDKRFYQHWGIDPWGIGRALWANIKAGGVVQGASTLTQQYVKNNYLSAERSLSRKIKEALISLILESYFSKEEILSAYINHVYLGQKGNRVIKGFQAASHYYFAKNLQNLNLAEMASLVAMVKAPASYAIRDNNKKALARRNLIIQLAAKNQLITTAQAKSLLKFPLKQAKTPIRQATFSGYIGLIKHNLALKDRLRDWQKPGVRIFTYLDIVKQIKLQHSIAQQLLKLEQQKKLTKGTLQASAIIVDKSNGHIVAAVGSRNEQLFGWNRLLLMKRPIGSLIKPFIYYTALADFHYTANSMLNDSAVQLESGKELWQPQNYDHRMHGQIPLWQALAKSYNLATVNLGLEIGIKNIQKNIYQCGYKEKLPEYPAFLLGVSEMSPYQLASLYQVLANQGFYAPLNTIEMLVDEKKIKQINPLQSKAVLKKGAVQHLEEVLNQVIKQGTARSLNWRLKAEQLPIAAKTGTSNDLKDSWFVAWDKRYLSLFWLGRDDNKPSGFSGSSGALVLYAAYQKVF